MLTKIHHVGIVVRSIDAAYAFYRDTLSLPVHKEDIIQDQGVKAALLTIGESEIELLEPIEPHTGVARFLARKGEGLHHLCFATDDIASELAVARNKGIALIDAQPRRGLAGMICFLHPKASHGVLIEYAQP
jgi:methylmalonyl-CoA/ethylmalonyl-CoA epimerase